MSGSVAAFVPQGRTLGKPTSLSETQYLREARDEQDTKGLGAVAVPLSWWS
jgi:hypothetical protein